MRTYLSSAIIGFSIIVTAAIFSHSFKNRNKTNNIISVTGLGKKDFVSDLIVWSGNFSEKSMNLKEAYASLDSKHDRIKQYLIGKGLSEDKIVFSAVNISKEYDEEFNKDGENTKRKRNNKQDQQEQQDPN